MRARTPSVAPRVVAAAVTLILLIARPLASYAGAGGEEPESRFVLHIPDGITLAPEVEEAMLAAMGEALDLAEEFMSIRMSVPIRHYWTGLPGYEEPRVLGCGRDGHGTHVNDSLPGPPESVDVAQKYGLIMLHEYVHAVVFERGVLLPALIGEGLAQMVRGVFGKANTHLVASVCLESGSLPSLRTLADWVHVSLGSWQFATVLNYEISPSLMLFLHDSLGRNAFLDMCWRMPDVMFSRPTEISGMVIAVIEDAMGMPLEQVEAAWHQCLREVDADANARSGLAASMRLTQHLYSTSDLSSVMYLSRAYGQPVAAFWERLGELNAAIRDLKQGAAGALIEHELMEQIDEFHRLAVQVRLELLAL